MCLRASNPKMRLSESNFGRTYITITPNQIVNFAISHYLSLTTSSLSLHYQTRAELFDPLCDTVQVFAWHSFTAATLLTFVRSICTPLQAWQEQSVWVWGRPPRQSNCSALSIDRQRCLLHTTVHNTLTWTLWSTVVQNADASGRHCWLWGHFGALWTLQTLVDLLDGSNWRNAMHVLYFYYHFERW